ncbi:Acyl-CoA synthetase family member 2 [Phytophthora nicotianae]|uniref:Acyl-CoA synthetase family member 2 n=1 Tax=Phytophthora nicotianae TaxID=4792 RepID=A0A0W8C3R3_PHYNI|nr:Acyl-CoA synthetase family member 2 [Phytophthora nicotianae]
MFSQKLDGEGYQTCTALVLLIQHGKTNTFGKMQHVGYMRNKDSYEAVFKHLGLSFNKKTHINRQQGVRQLECADVDISQTRRHGRWGMDTCEAIYAAPLAREAMRALSGHPPKSRFYFLERASVDPPLELQRLVFPEVEHCQKQILDGNWEDNLAARGFLDLLLYLRVVLLQDCAVLLDDLPAQFRQTSLFGEKFQLFRTQALAGAASATAPIQMQLQNAMPLLSTQISTQHAAVMQKLETRHNEITQLLAQTNNNLTSLLQGDMAFRLVPIDNASASVTSTNINLDTAESAHSQQSVPYRSSSGVTHEPTISDAQRYSMSRGVSTVRELWTEWHVGLSNRPSIESLEKKYGRKWRLSSKESKFYSRRHCVIKYVRFLINQGSTVESALNIAEAEKGTRSIDAFSKHLSKRKIS